MGFSIQKCYEYVIGCDMCGSVEVLHTGDCPTVDGETIYIHDINTAIKGALYHRSKGLLLCDECFKKSNDGKTL